MRFNLGAFRNELLAMIHTRKMEQAKIDASPSRINAGLASALARELMLLRGIVHAMDASTTEGT